MKTTLRTALAIFAAAALTGLACNKSHDTGTTPDMPSASSGTTPVAAAPAPKPTPTPAAGVTVTVLESNFNEDRCTQLTDPKYAGVVALIHKVKITNNSGANIYSKPAIFHSLKSTCGATGDNPGNAADLVTGDKSVDNGKEGTTTYTFPVNDQLCGDYQLDDTWRESNTFVIGKVIATGHDCPSCEAFKVGLDITGSGATRTVTAHFKAKPNKKLHVDFGDGQSADLADGQSTTHTWGSGSYTVTATLSSDGLDCPQTYSVTVDREVTCGDVNTKLGFATEASVHAASVTGTYNVCLQGSWNQPPISAPLDYGDSSSESVGTPFSKCHNYTQTDSQQNLTAKLTVVRGNLSCPATLPIVIPPKQKTCEDYESPAAPSFGGALALTGQTATQVTVTSGTVSPAGGSFSPTLPANVARPAFGSTGSFSTDYTVTVPYGPENLRCSKKFEHEYSISLPPQDCPKVNEWTLKNNRHDGVYTIVVVTNKNNPSGSIVESFDLSGGQSAHFDGYNNQTLHAFFKLPKYTEVTDAYYYDFNTDSNDTKNACTADGGTWLGNYSSSHHHVCKTPNDHGQHWTVPKSGPDDVGDLFKTDTHQEPNGFTYDFADSEASGACGAVAASGVEAQWVGDATLSVSCVCPVND